MFSARYELGLEIRYSFVIKGLKRPGCEVYHSTPASAKQRMSGVIPVLLLYTFMELTGNTVIYP